MMYENALVSFSGDLEKIIFTEAKNDTIKARAIVSTRDSTAENLDNLKKLLNSEIDTLKRQLETEAPEAAISETIEVLKANWFVKKNLIDTATRRILVTLGLSQIWNDRN
ncbi:hypothetical protein LRS73_35525 (plasmid) [Methylobacterium currus]|uniref:hypothetical protein n=1 Tax=Methylobacterium currus TaxID=2051553 RepID=UPI001E3BC6B2|nr:hypothetical protein [Methylobacterium currus]UHC20444.1 hypothetical protein LRS73_35525 [Methylobacterium currus]